MAFGILCLWVSMGGATAVVLSVLTVLSLLWAMRTKQMRLANGKTITQPGSRSLLIAMTLVDVVLASAVVTGFDFSVIMRRGNQFFVILEQIFSPDVFDIHFVIDPEGKHAYFLGMDTGIKATLQVFADGFGYMPKVITPLLDTIKMSILGSFVGATLALPFAVIASNNINRSKTVMWAERIILMVIRTLPTLVIAKFAALIFGLGTFAGTVAITVFTFGVVAKMMYESIETIDMGAFEAMESFGSTKFQSFWSACMPQILPTYLSYCLYALEMNIRAAAILGYVGAGGLGLLIDERIGWRDYRGLGTVLLALFVVVLIIEQLSQYLRRKLS